MPIIKINIQRIHQFKMIKVNTQKNLLPIVSKINKILIKINNKVLKKYLI